MSFNNAKVVAALNAFTVPLYLSNELVVGEERRELTRIHQQGFTKKLSVGTVHAFLLAPDGTLLDSVHVAQANPQRLVGMIEAQVAALKLSAGKPLLSPNPPKPPPAPSKGLRLHVVARYLERQTDGTLGIVTNAGGNWSALPGEDWLVLTQNDLVKLRQGESETVARLLTHFYPPTENNDLTKNRLEMVAWQTIRLGGGLLKIRGSVTLKHPFYHRDDDNRAVSAFVGYSLGDRFELTTTEGTYQRSPFGVAVVGSKD